MRFKSTQVQITKLGKQIEGGRTAKVSKQKACVFGNATIHERAGSRIRTDDLLITNQLLYQLSYAGIYLGKYSLMRPPRRSFYTPFLYSYVGRP